MPLVRWVLPSMDPAWRQECWDSMHPSVRARTLVVDNSEHNTGVAPSWNLGALQAQREGARWLVICSDSMRFGPPGGRDFEDRLTGPWADCGHNWHLIGFAMHTVQQVGLWDETFWPIYFEDADYERRMALSGLPTPDGATRTRPPMGGIDAWAADSGHSLKAGHVAVDLGVQAARYATKWGGPKGDERYVTPYGNPGLDLRAVTLGPDTAGGEL